MYAVEIASSEFKGKTLVQQHMMVNETLKGKDKNWKNCLWIFKIGSLFEDDIKGMHGIQIKTFAE